MLRVTKPGCLALLKVMGLCLFASWLGVVRAFSLVAFCADDGSSVIALSRAFHVAFMLHGDTDTYGKSLKINGSRL